MAGVQPGSDAVEATWASSTDPLVGRVLAGRYEISRLIGAGGMGRVYEGRQRALDRKVAVKCIHRHLLSSEPMMLRFMEEARVASRLLHPNIVKIYDFGTMPPSDGGAPFLVMELLAGPSLEDVIEKEAPFAIARAFPILRQILAALGEAHARGVTHRDAKPENIIVEPTLGGERVKIIDFGIARVHGAPGVTSAGQVIGTPHYMPPEQIRGDKAEVSSDLYAVGVIMFQMLTGELLFADGSPAHVLDQQLYAPRRDPRETARGRDCPAGLAAVCLRALDVDRAHRYESADAFAEALERAVVESLPPKSKRSYPPPSPTPWADVISEGAARRMQRSSAPPSSGARLVDIQAVERIERNADADSAAGRYDAALAELDRGLALGNRWRAAGEEELAAAVITGLGRRAGVVLRLAGRLEESCRTLEHALGHAAAGDLTRARILVELATALAEAGRPSEAEAHRLEALALADAHGDRELIHRLRRLAQSLALSVAGFGVPLGSAHKGHSD